MLTHTGLDVVPGCVFAEPGSMLAGEPGPALVEELSVLADQLTGRLDG